MKRNLSSIFELTEESHSKEVDNKRMDGTVDFSSSKKSNRKYYTNLQNHFIYEKENFGLESNRGIRMPWVIVDASDVSSPPKEVFTKTQNINTRMPFANLLNQRSPSCEALKSIDTKLAQIQKQLQPGLKQITQFRKKSKLIKATRNNSLLKNLENSQKSKTSSIQRLAGSLDVKHRPTLNERPLISMRTLKISDHTWVQAPLKTGKIKKPRGVDPKTGIKFTKSAARKLGQARNFSQINLKIIK